MASVDAEMLEVSGEAETQFGGSMTGSVHEENEELIEVDERVLGITVHKSSPLQPDRLLHSPSVKIHVVNAESGLYLQPTPTLDGQPEQTAVKQQLSSVSTKPFPVSRKKPQAKWGETVLVGRVKSSTLEPSSLVLFEVLDSSSPSSSSPSSSSPKSASQPSAPSATHPLTWKRCHRVAWAFLKVYSGPEGYSNVGGKCKLQLYRYPAPFYPGPHHPSPSPTHSSPAHALEDDPCHLWRVWSRHSRIKYPGFLSVSLHSLVPPPDNEEGQGRKLEEGNPQSTAQLNPVTGQDFLAGSGNGSETLPSPLPPPWSRLPGELCSVPARLTCAVRGGAKGGTALAFSRDGRTLAVAMVNDNSCPIGLFRIPDGKEIGQLSGHANLIHDLSWSHDDHMIISASSDCTARCWILGPTPTQIYLPHPSYVYSAKFHPTTPCFAMTGGYDAIIRAWRVSLPSTTTEQPHYELLMECSTEISHVNSLQFSSDGQRLFSGHGRGELRVWSLSPAHSTQPPSLEPLDIKVSCFEGQPIVSMDTHPLSSRLLVQARGHPPALVDLRIGQIQTSYRGTAVAGGNPGPGPHHHRGHAPCQPCLCSCGSHVLGAGEDGALRTWNTDTGLVVKVMHNLPPSGSIIYHPHDNIFAMVAYGNHGSILIFHH